jgi:microcompartment protein CcmL/EutN
MGACASNRERAEAASVNLCHVSHMVSHKPGTNLRSFFPMSQKKPSSKTEKQLLVFSEKEKRSSKKEREKIAQKQNNKTTKS